MRVSETETDLSPGIFLTLERNLQAYNSQAISSLEGYIKQGWSLAFLIVIFCSPNLTTLCKLELLLAGKNLQIL